MPNDARKRVEEIIRILKNRYPRPTTALDFSNPLEILIATILSAQCTDKRVNMVTKRIFNKYKTAKDYANANLEEFQEEIKSTGFYKNKAKNIINACKVIVNRYDGKVPDKMDDLVKLPGVARKTANVVLQMGYGIVDGIVVDTHVKRLSKRLRLSKEKNPEKIEQDLMKIIPRKHWMEFSFLMINHGRDTCTARNPKCSECIISEFCPSAFGF